MIRQTYYCDGCEKKLSPEVVNKNAFQRQSHETEIWCEKCLENAKEYWEEKRQLLVQLAAEFEQRITTHRRKFF